MYETKMPFTDVGRAGQGDHARKRPWVLQTHQRYATPAGLDMALTSQTRRHRRQPFLFVAGVQGRQKM